MTEITSKTVIGALNERQSLKAQIQKSRSEVYMNAGNKKRKWIQYCMDSKVLDRNGMAELRMTKDVPGYNPAMYVIVIFSVNGGIEETMSENSYEKTELLKMWEQWKND